MEVPTAAIAREHAQIAVEGKDAAAFYLIVSGRARAKTGDTAVDLGPGGMIGEEAFCNWRSMTGR
jgi:hypothetical protein